MSVKVKARFLHKNVHNRPFSFHNIPHMCSFIPFFIQKNRIIERKIETKGKENEKKVEYALFIIPFLASTNYRLKSSELDYSSSSTTLS